MDKKNDFDDLKINLPSNDKPKENGKNELLDTRKDVSILTSNISEMSAPDKPKMLEMLFNYKQGKIEQKAYLGNLQRYWDAQSQNFSKQAENAIKANTANMDKVLMEIQEAANTVVQDIISVSEENIQDRINQSLINCRKSLKETLLKIKDDPINEEIDAFTANQAVQIFTETFKKIRERRLVEFAEKHNLNNRD